MTKLEEILRSEKVRDSLVLLRRQIRTWGQSGDEHDKVEEPLVPNGVSIMRALDIGSDSLKSIVLDRFTELAPCTIEDLTEAFYRFALVPFENLEAGYYSLCSELIHAAAKRRRSPPFPIATGPFRMGPLTDHQSYSYGWVPMANIVLWNTEDEGFRLVICGSLPSPDSNFGVASNGVVYAFAEGQATESAFDRFCADCTLVLASFFSGMEQLNFLRSEFLLAGNPDESIPEEESYYNSHWCISQDGFALTTRFRLLYDWLHFFFCRDPERKTYATRLQTAIRLIGEANRQPNGAIAIALYVSAVESLLCRKGNDTTKMFAENISALLEPDQFNRRIAAKLATKVYAIRSDVFHGNNIAGAHEDLFVARVLALAVFKAILELVRFRRRMGESERPDDILNLLTDEYPTPGIPAGVEPSEAVLLWRHSASALSRIKRVNECLW